MKSKKFGANILLLSIVSLLNDISSEMVYPIVPIFLTSVLGVPTFVVGLVEGLADASSKILMSVSGYFSDRLHKRKLFVSVGYAFSAISHLTMSLSSSWPLVLFSRVLNRTGKGIRTSARDALITESTNKEGRAVSFGFHRTMDGLGGVIGPLLAVLLLTLLPNNFRLLFFLAFIPAFIGSLVVMFFVRDTRKKSGDDFSLKFEWKKTNLSFRLFLLISFIFAIGNSSDAFLILRSQNLGMSVGLTISAYVIYNLVSSIFSIPAGILSDKFGPKKVIFAGFLTFSLVYYLFATAKDSQIVWLLFPLYGLFMGLTEGVSKTYISKLVPHEISGSAFGLYQTAMGVATITASTLAGWMWSAFGPAYPFYFGSITALTAALLFFVLSRNLKTFETVKV